MNEKGVNIRELDSLYGGGFNEMRLLQGGRPVAETVFGKRCRVTGSLFSTEYYEFLRNWEEKDSEDKQEVLDRIDFLNSMQEKTPPLITR